MIIEYKAIPKALDKNKEIFADGVRVGEVSRSWLRDGGEQWVVSIPNISAFGSKTLKDLKRTISYKITNA